MKKKLNTMNFLIFNINFCLKRLIILLDILDNDIKTRFDKLETK